MTETSGGDAALPPFFAHAVEAVHTAVRRHGGVLLGLWELRRLGEDASDAVNAVLDVPAIKQLRLSWDLLLLLASDSSDSDVLMNRIGGNDLTLVTGAFYGWHDGAPPSAPHAIHSRGPVAVEAPR
jgi:hypothetical protein